MIEGEENKMMRAEDYENKVLRCIELNCGKQFDWTPEDQMFFQSKGLRYAPTRCLDCRRKRRELKQK